MDRCLSTDRSNKLKTNFDEHVTVTLDRTLLFDFANIARGVYSPLRGFVSRNDLL